MRANLVSLKGTIKEGKYFAVELELPFPVFPVTLQIPELQYSQIDDPEAILHEVIERINGKETTL